jgi:hypothetical protein
MLEIEEFKGPGPMIFLPIVLFEHEFDWSRAYSKCFVQGFADIVIPMAMPIDFWR